MGGARPAAAAGEIGQHQRKAAAAPLRREVAARGDFLERGQRHVGQSSRIESSMHPAALERSTNIAQDPCAIAAKS